MYIYKEMKQLFREMFRLKNLFGTIVGTLATLVCFGIAYYVAHQDYIGQFPPKEGIFFASIAVLFGIFLFFFIVLDLEDGESEPVPQQDREC
jgi:uncharacterized membrane protein YesL